MLKTISDIIKPRNTNIKLKHLYNIDQVQKKIYKYQSTSKSDNMIQSIRQLCKQHSQIMDTTDFITIHEAFGNHGDFLTVSFMLDALLQGADVTFLAIRENYAHYLSISKKMGKSIEQFGKNGKLKYYEAFASELCSELPLTQSSPSVFTRPPKFVTPLTLSTLNKIQIKQKSFFIVDAICFIEHMSEVCCSLFEKATEKRCRILFGGCTMNGKLSRLLAKQAGMCIRLERDVGGNGKFRLCDEKQETSVLWKFTQGKFQISKFIKI